MILSEETPEIEYTPAHAAAALDIMKRLLPFVSQYPEYHELIAILSQASRWREAHDHFTKIRVNITLPSDSRGENGLDAYFIEVAENAAKTAYNCSGAPAPFDNESYERLLLAETAFLEILAKGTR
jgi:hypothetical protein